MAKPRQKPSGKWEIALRHPQFVDGRKYFTFDTQEEAEQYARQWKLMKEAGLAPPAELLTRNAPAGGVRLARVLGLWEESGFAAPTQLLTLSTVTREVGGVKLADADYTWLNGYLRTLKVDNNLSPISIRHRMQALGRAIDEYLRHNPGLGLSNPVKLLPRGYSTYSDADESLAVANGGKAKVNTPRDRRLRPGEHELIVKVLSGWESPDRPRGLQLKGGAALLTMYLMIVNTGLRLREAYMLKRHQLDMEGKVIRVQQTKQWRGKISFRDVPMRPEVYHALTDYMAARPMLPNAYVFPFMEEEGADKLSRVSQRLSDRFRIAFQYVGITGLHEHDLRHEATCRWLELKDAQGRDMFRLEELNRIMGWKPGSLMAQRYASFRAEDLAQRLWVVPEGRAASSDAA